MYSKHKFRLCSQRNLLWLRANWNSWFVFHAGGSDGTESPNLRRWTGLHYTEPGDDGADPFGVGVSDSTRNNGEIWQDQVGAGYGSSAMKSTRHLPPQSKYQDNFHKNFYSHRSPTSATIQVGMKIVCIFWSGREGFFSQFCNVRPS